MMTSVADYGVLPANTGAQNDAAIAALFADFAAGVQPKLEFPEPRDYQFAARWPFRSMGIEGQGWSTRLLFNQGMWLPSSGIVDRFFARDIYMSNNGSGNHLMNLNNVDGVGEGVINAHFDNVEMHVDGANMSLVSATNNPYNLFGWRFRNCRLRRGQVTATNAPAFNIATTSAGLSHWSFRDCEMHSFENLLPFFIAAFNGTKYGAPGFEFDNIIGERSVNGLINLQGMLAPVLKDVVDWDVASPDVYAASLIRISAGANVPSQKAEVADCGTTSSLVSFAGSQYHVKITGGTGHAVSRIFKGQQDGSVSVT